MNIPLIFKNIKKQNSIVGFLFTITFVVVIFVTFLYPFYLIQIINLNNWRFLEAIELVYWLSVSTVCIYLVPQFLFFNKRKNKRKINLLEKISVIIGLGMFVCYGLYCICTTTVDFFEGTKDYFGECYFTYNDGKRSTHYYVIIEGNKKLHISSNNYFNHKSLDYCRVVYLPNTEKGLSIKSK